MVVAKAKSPRRKKDVVPVEEKIYYVDARGSGGWFPLVREPFTGAWQRNIEDRFDTVFSNTTLFRCITLIQSDIAKLRIKLTKEDPKTGIWEELYSPAFSPVLKKPNDYQNRIQFIQSWIISKLSTGNTYVLKQRDNRNVVVRLYVLDPLRCYPVVTPDGDVYYQVRRDDLSGIDDDNYPLIPAHEIIHDRMNTLFHPLCGLSPIYAAGLSAIGSQNTKLHANTFFRNGANPGGILIAPGNIPSADVERIENAFSRDFSGQNAGKIAVLGNGLKFEPLGMTAVNAQLIEQLQFSAKDIAAAFGVPAYKVGADSPPSYNNIEALNQQYYQECLQIHIESIELCLDEGLGLNQQPETMGTEFDLEGLLRMDTPTMATVAATLSGAGIEKIDESRARFNLAPTEGGDTCYLQQQNYSLAALAKRDAKEDPFTTTKEPVQPKQPEQPLPEQQDATQRAIALYEISKGLGYV